MNFPKPFLPLLAFSRPVGATADTMELIFLDFPLSSSWSLLARPRDRALAALAPESLLELVLPCTGLAFATRLPFWALDGQHWKESYAEEVGGTLLPPKPMKKQPSRFLRRRSSLNHTRIDSARLHGCIMHKSTPVSVRADFYVKESSGAEPLTTSLKTIILHYWSFQATTGRSWRGLYILEAWPRCFRWVTVVMRASPPDKPINWIHEGM